MHIHNEIEGKKASIHLRDNIKDNNKNIIT